MPHRIAHFITGFATVRLSFIPDPPEISVENPIVYSGEGQEAMLVCIVHGESQPEVSTLREFIKMSAQLLCCLRLWFFFPFFLSPRSYFHFAAVAATLPSLTRWPGVKH